MVRITSPHLNKYVKSALASKAHILKNAAAHPDPEGREATAIPSSADPAATNAHPFGEDVKMIRQHKLHSRLLTPAEKDEAITKYQSGLNMTEVAKIYGCDRTTILRTLRKRGVAVRS